MDSATTGRTPGTTGNARAALLQDANGFFRTFEEEVEFILGHVAGEDEDYAHEQLEAIIERSGVNG